LIDAAALQVFVNECQFFAVGNFLAEDNRLGENVGNVTIVDGVSLDVV